MPTQHDKAPYEMTLADRGPASRLSYYPIDMSSFLTLSQDALDIAGVPCHVSPAGYHPTTIAQYALAHWNQYLATNDERHCKAFLTQACWLAEHEFCIGDDAGGWPIFFPHPDFPTIGPWLSAVAQASGISVLLRAYQLAHDEAFFKAAQRAVRTFERDILDGGVSTPVDIEGVFFEEVAVYPAAHTLSGCLIGLLGLYDYVALTGDEQFEKLIHRSIATIHRLLDLFNAGFWTHSDLLYRRLASPSQLRLQVMLLEALGRISDCNRCSTTASHWKGYQNQFGSRLRYQITSRSSKLGHALWSRIQTALYHKPQVSLPLRVCVPLNAFPVTGGIRTVLDGVAQVTADVWRLEYLTRFVGPHADGLAIHRFGSAIMTPRQFPTVWLYALAGFHKLISLVRNGPGYHLILPQDGVFTGVFAALAGKLAGARVVCIDHGTLTLLKSRTYRNERMQALATKSYPHRLLRRLLFLLYWPSINLMARLAVRFIDHFLIPGIAGDGVEESCTRLGAHPSRITRFASMVDMERHVIPDAATRTSLREKNGIAADAIVITMACRLAPEKGINVALEVVSRVLSELSPPVRARVRVVIAGDGPLREQIEQDIGERGLLQTCLLRGEISAADTISLLGLSDIFLYTSVRGACFSMAVLEAMASGCAVVASTEPKSNAHLLAEGRGIAVPPGDVAKTSAALIRLVNDLELCRQMGRLARNYIAVQHSGAMFRRTLMRVTYWSALDEILNKEKRTVYCENTTF